MNIETFVSAETLAQITVERIEKACKSAISQRGVFHLALAGGTTPKRCYELLAKSNLAWDKLHIYFGDERCLPIGDSERNDTMAKQVWLDHVSIPADQIHAMPAELGANAGAISYAKILAITPQLDLVLLGLGEDGHTASLFPNNAALDNDALAVPVFDSPKAPAERISMGKAYINAAREKWFLVSGVGKYDAVTQIVDGVLLPAAEITDAQWLMEEASMFGVDSATNCC